MCMGRRAEEKESMIKAAYIGNSLAVQWLGLHASTAGGTGSIPGRGTNIPHAMRHSQKKPPKNPAYIIRLHTYEIKHTHTCVCLCI